MKHFSIITLMVILLNPAFVFAQNQQAEIDSLVNKMRTAGREWNDYANPLIKIGEPAVPALIKNVKDKNLSQWNRRISLMTLNSIHSPNWKESALNMLFDEKEDPVLRNHVTAGLRGCDLTDVKTELWELYEESEDPFYKSNLAYLLLTADTALAYKAFYDLYLTQEGHIQKSSLLNLAKLQPEESTDWFLKGIQVDDWMTANLAMDSLINSGFLKSDDLISVYKQFVTSEEVKWRIVYVFGHREDAKLISFLVDALQNENWLVHTEAAIGLCRLDKEKVMAKMKPLKNDSRLFVRNNSRWIIRQLRKE